MRCERLTCGVSARPRASSAAERLRPGASGSACGPAPCSQPALTHTLARAQDLQAGGSPPSGVGRAPVSLPRMAEALAGDASPACVLAAMRALAADRTFFKQA